MKAELETAGCPRRLLTLHCGFSHLEKRKIRRIFFVPQASDEVSKCLVSMKEILYGSSDKEPHTETVAQLAQELYNSGLLISLVQNLQVIDFEVRGNPRRIWIVGF